MRNQRSHSVIDYSLAAAMALSPYVFGFANVHYARNIFIFMAVTVAGYSLLTDYEYSIAEVIPLSMHRVFDVISGVFLMLAPSIYDYRHELGSFPYALHFIYGIGLIALVVFTGGTTGLRPLAEEEPQAEAAPEERRRAA